MAGSRTRAGFRARSGFTLFEVLAAVAVLGLLYVVLADVAIRGMLAEGLAGRMLRASVLADSALADLEAGFANGTPAPQGREEIEEEDFLIETEVAAFDLAGAVLALAPPQSTRPRGRGPRTAELLAAPQQGEAPLVRLGVRVSWQEGAHEREVLRTGFAFDRVAAAPTLESLAGALADRGDTPSDGNQGPPE